VNGRCGSIAWTAPLTAVYVNFLLQLPTVRKMILIPRPRPPTVPALLQGAALSLKRRREEASWRRQTRGRPVIFRLVGKPDCDLKAVGMIVWQRRNRSDRASHRTLRPVKLLERIVWHGGPIKPRISLRVAYEVGAARPQTVRSPRTMYPHS